MLTVAHRLATVVYYDRVLVMDQGRIVEYDTPLSLLNRYVQPSSTPFVHAATALLLSLRLLHAADDDVARRMLVCRPEGLLHSMRVLTMSFSLIQQLLLLLLC